jgi:hypothetical protein
MLDTVHIFQIYARFRVNCATIIPALADDIILGAFTHLRSGCILIQKLFSTSWQVEIAAAISLQFT